LILRLEDIDGPRVVAGAEAEILDDLRWLGIDWDEGPDVGGASAPYRQSERLSGYAYVLDRWRRERRIYPCDCSRKEIESLSAAPHGAETVYPGTCREGDVDETIERARVRKRHVSWRFRTHDERIEFDDGVHGRFGQNVRTDAGDFVVSRSDGVIAYQLAVVLDDAAMGVTQVVRADDLLGSTPRQIALLRALGAAVPEYAHVPLVVADDGTRLAKRHGATGIRALRAAGVTATRLRQALWISLGQTGSVLPSRFDFACVPRAALRLDELRPALPEIG